MTSPSGFSPNLRALLACLALLPLAARVEAQRAVELERPNIVLIVLDDLGVDKVRAYQEGPPGVAPPCTPNLDALAAEGLLFRNAWASPVCSPTRAQLLTGRYGFRTGVGKGQSPRTGEPGLRVDLEVTLPELLVGYERAALGKWHLLSHTYGEINHPLDAGFHSYAGNLFFLNESWEADCTPGGSLGYYNWAKAADVTGTGTLEEVCTTKYATTDTADDAIITAKSMRAPWFLYVSFNAPHVPLEEPPAHLCPPAGTCPTVQCPYGGSDEGLLSNAMIEALDTEVGRLIVELRRQDPDVYIFVIGDNGTATASSQGPEGSCFAPGRAKAKLYEAGLNVPLIVAGPDVVPGECQALVNATDLFRTILELAGVKGDRARPLPFVGRDSVSMVRYLRGDHRPRRRTVYQEQFTPNQEPDLAGVPFTPRLHWRVIRDERYKLHRITFEDGTTFEQFFDLLTDPCEEVPLCLEEGECGVTAFFPDPAQHYADLVAEMVRLGTY